ncbi:hypothetical protein MASR1M36_09310 [Candidatus Cloacimonadaceae bacterium]
MVQGICVDQNSGLSDNWHKKCLNIVKINSITRWDVLHEEMFFTYLTVGSGRNSAGLAFENPELEP